MKWAAAARAAWKVPVGRLPQARSLHLAPPFLLDDYIPRVWLPPSQAVTSRLALTVIDLVQYMTLSSRDAALKRSRAYAHLRNCNLCPRLCGVNRYEKTGVCLIGTDVVVNVIAPHFGEEPCVQGHNGSGSVFFSMCNLRCSFCQNHDIAHQKKGFNLSPEQLGEWFVKLQEVGATHNINLITPEHVVPQVALAIMHARELGLTIPIIYNTSSYDSLASIELLDGLVDIYLPDFKVWEPSTSKRLLKAPDYAAAARESIKAMHAQVGDLCFTGDGIAKKGVLVRHLVMPGLEAESKKIMEFLAEEVSTDCFVNIMEQYHPDAHVGKPRRKTSGGKDEEAERSGGSHDEVRYPDINRAVTNDEISSVRKAAEAAGLWRFCDPPGTVYIPASLFTILCGSLISLQH